MHPSYENLTNILNRPATAEPEQEAKIAIQEFFGLRRTLAHDLILAEIRERCKNDNPTLEQFIVAGALSPIQKTGELWDPDNERLPIGPSWERLAGTALLGTILTWLTDKSPDAVAEFYANYDDGDSGGSIHEGRNVKIWQPNQYKDTFNTYRADGNETEYAIWKYNTRKEDRLPNRAYDAFAFAGDNLAVVARTMGMINACLQWEHGDPYEWIPSDLRVDRNNAEFHCALSPYWCRKVENLLTLPAYGKIRKPGTPV